MADCYWIDVTGALGWDDTTLGVSGWAATSGGATDGRVPGDGDNVFFDANSGAGGIADGPDNPISLTTLDMTGALFGLTSGQTSDITITGTLIAAMETVWSGGLVSPVTATFNGTSSCASGVSFPSTSTINFNTGTTNNATAATPTTSINFNAGSTNAGALVAGVITFAGSVANNANITPTTCTVLATGNVTGPGTIAGPVTITGDGSAESATYDAGTITGAVTITLGGYNRAFVIGNVTASGSASKNRGDITGNLTLSGGAENFGLVNGILTAPGVRNANGTIGSTSPSLGSFTTLNLTGIPAGGGGTVNIGKSALIG